MAAAWKKVWMKVSRSFQVELLCNIREAVPNLLLLTIHHVERDWPCLWTWSVFSLDVTNIYVKLELGEQEDEEEEETEWLGFGDEEEEGAESDAQSAVEPPVETAEEADVETGVLRWIWLAAAMKADLNTVR